MIIGWLCIFIDFNSFKTAAFSSMSVTNLALGAIYQTLADSGFQDINDMFELISETFRIELDSLMMVYGFKEFRDLNETALPKHAEIAKNFIESSRIENSPNRLSKFKSLDFEFCQNEQMKANNIPFLKHEFEKSSQSFVRFQGINNNNKEANDRHTRQIKNRQTNRVSFNANINKSQERLSTSRESKSGLGKLRKSNYSNSQFLHIHSQNKPNIENIELVNDKNDLSGNAKKSTRLSRLSQKTNCQCYCHKVVESFDLQLKNLKSDLFNFKTSELKPMEHEENQLIRTKLPKLNFGDQIETEADKLFALFENGRQLKTDGIKNPLVLLKLSQKILGIVESSQAIAEKEMTKSIIKLEAVLMENRNTNLKILIEDLLKQNVKLEDFKLRPYFNEICEKINLNEFEESMKNKFQQAIVEIMKKIGQSLSTAKKMNTTDVGVLTVITGQSESYEKEEKNHKLRENKGEIERLVGIQIQDEITINELKESLTNLLNTKTSLESKNEKLQRCKLENEAEISQLRIMDNKNTQKISLFKDVTVLCVSNFIQNAEIITDRVAKVSASVDKLIEQIESVPSLPTDIQDKFTKKKAEFEMFEKIVDNVFITKNMIKMSKNDEQILQELKNINFGELKTKFEQFEKRISELVFFRNKNLSLIVTEEKKRVKKKQLNSMFYKQENSKKSAENEEQSEKKEMSPKNSNGNDKNDSENQNKNKNSDAIKSEKENFEDSYSKNEFEEPILKNKSNEIEFTNEADVESAENITKLKATKLPKISSKIALKKKEKDNEIYLKEAKKLRKHTKSKTLSKKQLDLKSNLIEKNLTVENVNSKSNLNDFLSFELPKSKSGRIFPENSIMPETQKPKSSNFIKTESSKQQPRFPIQKVTDLKTDGIKYDKQLSKNEENNKTEIQKNENDQIYKIAQKNERHNKKNMKNRNESEQLETGNSDNQYVVKYSHNNLIVKNDFEDDLITIDENDHKKLQKSKKSNSDEKIKNDKIGKQELEKMKNSTQINVHNQSLKQIEIDKNAQPTNNQNYLNSDNKQYLINVIFEQATKETGQEKQSRTQMTKNDINSKAFDEKMKDEEKENKLIDKQSNKPIFFEINKSQTILSPNIVLNIVKTSQKS